MISRTELDVVITHLAYHHHIGVQAHGNARYTIQDLRDDTVITLMGIGGFMAYFDTVESTSEECDGIESCCEEDEHIEKATEEWSEKELGQDL